MVSALEMRNQESPMVNNAEHRQVPVRTMPEREENDGIASEEALRIVYPLLIVRTLATMLTS